MNTSGTLAVTGTMLTKGSSLAGSITDSVYGSAADGGVTGTLSPILYRIRYCGMSLKRLTIDCNVDNVVTSSSARPHHRTFINDGEGYIYLLEDLKVIANGVWVFRGDVNKRHVYMQQGHPEPNAGIYVKLLPGPG
ncbi:hypothetical protein [Paenibacillus oceani]|nr:hypothetical protein [Paenibacillus oceani]